eukprot:TRINITY_DN42031_c0_g1_i1.p1 TRINITY_DN42031_c0_g1~~TRINITY_DN42031_c0_g1_i1.p1  ORF type:complete len:186 (-),score=23.19 TRINITY_DN42031_c0_g1_i1:302-859(-)
MSVISLTTGGATTIINADRQVQFVQFTLDIPDCPGWYSRLGQTLDHLPKDFAQGFWQHVISIAKSIKLPLPWWASRYLSMSNKTEVQRGARAIVQNMADSLTISAESALLLVQYAYALHIHSHLVGNAILDRNNKAYKVSATTLLSLRNESLPFIEDFNTGYDRWQKQHLGKQPGAKRSWLDWSL